MTCGLAPACTRAVCSLFALSFPKLWTEAIGYGVVKALFNKALRVCNDCGKFAES